MTQRYGNFSSSEIHWLMQKSKTSNPFSVKGQTYIRQKRYESRLQRPLKTDSDTRATIWGKFIESYVHELLTFDYRLCSKERLAHKEIPNWTGAPDLITADTVVDIKCPQLESFCELADICKETDPFELKAVYPEYYWQLVSNSILTGLDFAELIVFAPYKSELPGIRERAFAADAMEWGNKLYYIQYGEDLELPYINDGGYYQNINKLTFKVPAEDKALLTDRVQLAIEQLITH